MSPTSAAGDPFQPGGLLRSEPRAVTAEWALWGKEAHETGYHVLRCSRGVLREKDFTKAVTRYSPGEIDGLPHYTVSWIPGTNQVPEYLALGIHEVAPPTPTAGDDRSHRDAVGREIVFVRLFCVRYADLAAQALRYPNQALGYRDLQRAVDHIQFPVGATEPVRVTLPPDLAPLAARGAARRQAEQVATMLLTGRQVCVLGADDVGAEERLQFIDTAMAMLPYGLRATMSAATSANSASQDLKLRLFFAAVPREGARLGGGRSHGEDFRVEWGKPDESDTGDPVAELYRRWLQREAKSRAAAMLAHQVVPVRFADPDIRRMLGNLPEDKSVLATLDDLASGLKAKDLDPEAFRKAVRTAVMRLRRYLAGQAKPDDPPELQREYYGRVCQFQLLADDSRLSSVLKGKLYDELLPLAFGPALTYDGFCEIERSVGFPLPASLRSALARFPAADWLAYLLAREGQKGFHGDNGPTDGTPVPPGEPADVMTWYAQEGRLQQRHGMVALDWALRDLDKRSVHPGELLAARGYLAAAHEHVYRHDPQAQVTQLKRVLKIAFDDGMLARPQIDLVFHGQYGHQPTPALVHAVTMRTARRHHGYVQDQARRAYLRAQGVPESEIPSRRAGVAGWLQRHRLGRGRASSAPPPGSFGQPAFERGPRNHVLSTDSPWEHPRILFTFLVTALALFALAYFCVVLMLRSG